MCRVEPAQTRPVPLSAVTVTCDVSYQIGHRVGADVFPDRGVFHEAVN
ncbi:hypothetical protein NY08_3197 [Rhodococcus sp. B7740]|nr:hypothetical protein NY08_3197 [Rhodococcus sp. B7740]